MAASPPPLHPSERWFILALAGYFLLFAITRILISDALELDEAEQVLLSQWWQWGYSAQPPLYTWLLAAVHSLFGVHIAASALLREGLLFLACLFTWLIARRLLQPRLLAAAAVLSLLTIPQIVWENQREHTHSLLVLLVAAVTLWLLLRLLERRRLVEYLLLGLTLALGVLAKYNFALFAGALGLALLTLPAGRRLVWDWRTLPALALALAVLTPHLLWLADHTLVGAALDARLSGEAPAAPLLAPLRALWLVAWTTLSFLTPFWVLFAVLFPRALGAAWLGPVRPRDPRQRLIGRWLALGLGALCLVAWAFGADGLKERWLQPLLFIVPVWLFQFVAVPPLDDAAAVRRHQRLRWFAGIAAGCGVLVLVMTAVRLPLAPLTGVYSRLHQPIAALAAQLGDRLPDGALIIAADYHLAGALRLHLPGDLHYGPRDDFQLPSPATLASGRAVALVWDAERSPQPPADLLALATAAGLPTAGAIPALLEAPYHYGPFRRYQLGVLLLPRPTPARPPPAGG